MVPSSHRSPTILYNPTSLPPAILPSLLLLLLLLFQFVSFYFVFSVDFRLNSSRYVIQSKLHSTQLNLLHVQDSFYLTISPTPPTNSPISLHYLERHGIISCDC